MGGLVAVALIAGTLGGVETLERYAWFLLLYYVGGIAAVALAVGAIRTSAHPPSRSTYVSDRPSNPRKLFAGLAGLVCLAAAGVGTPFLLGGMLSGYSGPTGVGSGVAFTFLALGMFVAASLAAWIAGRAIAHPRRRGSSADARSPFNT